MSETEHETADLEDQIAAEMTPEPDAGTPEPEPEPDGAPEPEPESEPAADSAAEMEAIGKKLDALNKHVARKMGDILGEQAQEFEECEVCSFYNTPGWRFSGPYPPEVESAVRAVLNIRAPAEFAPDSFARVCEACNGFGETLSGSKVPGRETLPCYVCKANGWVPVGDERASGSMFFPNGGTPAYTPPAADSTVAMSPGEPDPPEVAALKAKGYMVVAPFTG